MIEVVAAGLDRRAVGAAGDRENGSGSLVHERDTVVLRRDDEVLAGLVDLDLPAVAGGAQGHFAADHVGIFRRDGGSGIAEALQDLVRDNLSVGDGTLGARPALRLHVREQGDGKLTGLGTGNHISARGDGVGGAGVDIGIGAIRRSDGSLGDDQLEGGLRGIVIVILRGDRQDGGGADAGDTDLAVRNRGDLALGGGVGDGGMGTGDFLRQVIDTAHGIGVTQGPGDGLVGEAQGLVLLDGGTVGIVLMGLVEVQVEGLDAARAEGGTIGQVIDMVEHDLLVRSGRMDSRHLDLQLAAGGYAERDGTGIEGSIGTGRNGLTVHDPHGHVGGGGAGGLPFHGIVGQVAGKAAADRLGSGDHDALHHDRTAGRIDDVIVHHGQRVAHVHVELGAARHIGDLAVEGETLAGEVGLAVVAGLDQFGLDRDVNFLRGGVVLAVRIDHVPVVDGSHVRHAAFESIVLAGEIEPAAIVGAAVFLDVENIEGVIGNPDSTVPAVGGTGFGHFGHDGEVIGETLACEVSLLRRLAGNGADCPCKSCPCEMDQSLFFHVAIRVLID